MDTYKKKYKELVAWINLLSHSALTIDQHKIVDVILERSEKLAESEDDRIRKAIVATIHLYYGEPLEDEAKEMIAWIEKQEQKPTDEEMKTLLRIEYEKGRADTIAEMQVAWSEEDEEFLRRAINATKDAYPITAKWLKSLKIRIGG